VSAHVAEAAFATLCADAAACQVCATMAGRRRVLTPANGRPDARVLFIGEAPGRFGGERTGVPFSGDRTGHNFALLLDAAGLDRADIFITNAILCNPRDAGGRNRGPSREELVACRPFLARQLATIDAPFIVTLGAVALAATAAIAPHRLRLRDAVRQAVGWQGRTLMPLYHPGPRAQLHRSFAIQQADFVALGALVRG